MRTAIVVLAALFLGFLVFRVAFVQALGAKDSSKAAAIWPGHPTVLLESGLAEVGEMAAAGRSVSRPLVNRLLSASAKAPLAPEPFLVRGVEAQLAGDQQLALRAFLAARQRNPRAVAARYFLADHYLKAGQPGPGLDEISALARFVPQSLPDIAPYLAAYARSPGAAPQVKALLLAHPQLEPALLDELAKEAGNLNLVLHLWGGGGEPESQFWQPRMLNSLVEAGRYDQARSAWERFTGKPTKRDRLFDPEFSAQALPPFDWTLASGPAGVAEAQNGGRLHALFYGRDDLVLASQLMTLAPGRYRLSMQVSGVSRASKSLAWTIRCLPASNELGAISLDRAGLASMTFEIPATGCEAQRLDLGGVAPEIPMQAEATISQLRLQKKMAGS